MRFSERPEDFFAELESALSLVPRYDKVYDGFDHTFVRCLNALTRTSDLIWGGTFAKTNHILMERKADSALSRRVNDVRVRLRRKNDLEKGKLMDYCYDDFASLCLFVAFAYGVEVPPALRLHFPKHSSERHIHKTVLDECMRVIVADWDDRYIYAKSAVGNGEERLKITLTEGEDESVDNRLYLKKLLTRGAQLNLVHPSERGGYVNAELIIYEPDYLVDISTVASCFTAYADSANVHLINKFRPSRVTEAILLGNFASQLLDETIHQNEQPKSYAESATEFFHKNALGILSAGLSKGFHLLAREQQKYIARAIEQTLPASVNDFDKGEAIVEPSFFSEMLGLQGRMDFLQLDYKVLIEQKSGNGAFPYDNYHVPHAATPHYVQMLLYMLLIRYNHSDVYKRNGRELHAFLLYSKYEESLLGLGFAPRLVHEAIRVRNQMVWNEINAATNDRMSILERLTADDLNEKGLRGKLWTNFIHEQIEEVLRPVREASEVERQYFFRFVRFLENEQLQAKLGNQTKENSGFASKWYDSLEEKRLAGNIYDALTLVTPAAGHTGKVEEAVLAFSETTDNNMANFRVGDIVLLYAYTRGKEPDVRRNMTFRCHILRVMNDKIVLSLRVPQSDARAFLRQNEGDKLWAIEHDFVESSFAPLYRGMHAFLSAPKQRRDLLLFQREAETDTTRTLKGEYGTFNSLQLRVKQAKDLFLIIGPPGTGKTSFGMLNTLKEELLEEGSHILILSYTNRAVDEICSKLVAEHIDFIRMGSENGCAPDYRVYLMQERVKAARNVNEVQRTIQQARVIVGTTTALNQGISIFERKAFSLAIIDEASQILEPHLVGLLSAHCNGECRIKKFVLIGDHKQLPAVVQQQAATSAVEEEALHRIMLTNCRLSLFERLLRRYGHDERFTYMLRRQGRMHPLIAHFPNIMFYGGELEEVPLPHQTALLPRRKNDDDPLSDLIATHRIAFINVPTPTDAVSDKVNTAEADLVAAIAERVYHNEPQFQPDETLGVIVPYRNQIVTILSAIEHLGIRPLSDISIDTVERYQGSQRAYIVYDFTIRKPYQLNFLTDHTFTDTDGTVVDRKLNVAMTRAEEHLIMVGNARLLSRAPVFESLIEYVKKQHAFFSLTDILNKNPGKNAEKVCQNDK